MRNRRSRTLSFTDEEWAQLTAASQLAGFNRSVTVAHMAKMELTKYPADQVEAALIKARADTIKADA